MHIDKPDSLKGPSWVVPVLETREFRIRVEPVHGGVLVVVMDSEGTPIDRIVVTTRPQPQFLPLRILKWATTLCHQVLRVYLTPPEGWEALEARTKSAKYGRARRTARPDEPRPDPETR